ncbi:MAG: FAD-binding oxidoreductase [Rhodocyclaceae bacterium]|nr:FAD-binding oxidoreductase [Rhodocyclaceae bacterium]
MELNKALEQWSGLLGTENVLDEPSAQALFGRCTSGARRRILGAVRARENAEIPAIVAVAARFRVPLYPISTGHNWGYGTALPAQDGCVILDLSALNRILDFDAESGVVTLEPGVTQGILADFLDRGGHPFLVPVTGAGPTCSIVGNALERGYGITPHADHFGAVTALEVVLADGRVYRPALSGLNGVALDQAFKWGIGPYVDGIFTQSGMGIVTKMSLALARRPECVRAFLFGLEARERIADIVPRVREVLARYPGVVGAVNLMNAHRVLAMSVDYPGDRLGADGLIPPAVISELGRGNQVMPWTGFGTIYGTKGVVKAVEREIRQILRPLARRLIFLSPELVGRLSRLAGWLPEFLRARVGKRLDMLRRSLELVAGRPNETAMPLCYWRGGKLPEPGGAMDPARDGCGLMWYAPLVLMKAEQVSEYVAMVEAIMYEYKIEPLITLTSISDRCFDSTVPLLFDVSSEASLRNAEDCFHALLKAGQEKGFLPYRVGIQAMDWITEDGGTYWQVVRQIKKALDPDGILAPGRYN